MKCNAKKNKNFAYTQQSGSLLIDNNRIVSNLFFFILRVYYENLIYGGLFYCSKPLLHVTE